MFFHPCGFWATWSFTFSQLDLVVLIGTVAVDGGVCFLEKAARGQMDGQENKATLKTEFLQNVANGGSRDTDEQRRWTHLILNLIDSALPVINSLVH